MPWVCLPVGRIKHLAPAALAALMAAHPIPTGKDCYCTGTRLAYVPDSKDHGAARHDPQTQAGVPPAPDNAPDNIPDVPLPSDYVPPFGWHGPGWTPPVLFVPVGGGGPWGGSGGGGPGGTIPINYPGGGGGSNVPPGGNNGGGGGDNVPPGGGNGGGGGSNLPPPQNVPEPASSAVLIVALAGLATLRWRVGRTGRAR